jgi:excisionase family DNA binding protein
MSETSEAPSLLSVEQAAAVLGRRRSFVYAKLLGVELPVVKLGRSTKVTRVSVDAYIGRLVTAEKKKEDWRVRADPPRQR